MAKLIERIDGLFGKKFKLAEKRAFILWKLLSLKEILF